MKTLFRIICICTFVVLGVVGCDGNDCPTCPKDEPVEPFKGWLFYTDLMYNRSDLYKVDMETDSIVDSIEVVAEQVSAAVSASPDGRYVAVSYTNPEGEGVRCRIYDAGTLELIREADRTMAPLGFAEDGTLICWSTELVGFPDFRLARIFMLSPPAFDVTSEDTMSDFSPLSPIDARHHRLFGVGSQQLNFNHFWVYDYSARTFERIPIRVSTADTVQVWSVAAAADGDRLFFTSLGGGSWMGCWSIALDSLLWKQPILSTFGDLALSPDESELWRTDAGPQSASLNPGTIYIYHPETGGYLGGISLRGYGASPYEALTGNWIHFSPTGEKVYVATGLVAWSSAGTLLSIDRRSRSVTKLFAPNLDSAPAQGAICPRI